MSSQTLFYIFGIAAAVSAVLVSFAGLKLRSFPGRFFPLVILWFAILVGGATTFAVIHAQDEEQHKEAELQLANEEIEKEETGQPAEAEPEAAAEPESEAGAEAEPEAEPEAAAGAGSTVKLAASPTAIAFDTTSLTAKAGKVTIDFDNPAPIEHDVAIEKDGKELAVSELITESETSVSAELEPGTYTFLCTVPGHAAAGMEGTLVVK